MSSNGTHVRIKIPPLVHRLQPTLIPYAKVIAIAKHCPMNTRGVTIDNGNISLNILSSQLGDRLIQKNSFLLTTTKFLGPTQDIQNIIENLRIPAFLQCATYLVWWVLWSVNCDKSGKLSSTWHFFVQVLIFYVNFYKKSALNASTFLTQKNY